LQKDALWARHSQVAKEPVIDGDEAGDVLPRVVGGNERQDRIRVGAAHQLDLPSLQKQAQEVNALGPPFGQQLQRDARILKDGAQLRARGEEFERRQITALDQIGSRAGMELGILNVGVEEGDQVQHMTIQLVVGGSVEIVSSSGSASARRSVPKSRPDTAAASA